MNPFSPLIRSLCNFSHAIGLIRGGNALSGIILVVLNLIFFPCAILLYPYGFIYVVLRLFYSRLEWELKALRGTLVPMAFVAHLIAVFVCAFFVFTLGIVCLPILVFIPFFRKIDVDPQFIGRLLIYVLALLVFVLLLVVVGIAAFYVFLYVVLPALVIFALMRVLVTIFGKRN